MFKSDYLEGSESAFKRVASHDQKSINQDSENAGEQVEWFRQRNNEEKRNNDFSNNLRDNSTYIGGIYSRNFSEYQPHIRR